MQEYFVRQTLASAAPDGGLATFSQLHKLRRKIYIIQ